VYRGEATLAAVVDELLQYAEGVTPSQRPYQITEIILVWDHGDDNSPDVMRRLARDYEIVRAVWLMRNYGQHAATLAGIASTGSDWIVTLDEDGQHDPSYLPEMIDRAFVERSRLVYFDPTNKAPHGFFRNIGSWSAKLLFRLITSSDSFDSFSSYRLIHGETARTVAAYTGPGVYLDVALIWVTDGAIKCPGLLRSEQRTAQSYTYRKLASHAFRMIVSSGTRPLRIIAFFGFVLGLFGFFVAGVVVYERIFQSVPVQGWTSMMIALLITGGAILVSLAVIAEYLGIAVSAVLGKPLYAIGSSDGDVFDTSDS